MILNLTGQKIKPSGCKHEDGIIKLTLVLPLSADDSGKKAVEKFVLQHRFEDAKVVFCDKISAELTAFTVHAKTKYTLKSNLKANKEKVASKAGARRMSLQAVVENAVKDFASTELGEAALASSARAQSLKTLANLDEKKAEPQKAKRRGRRGGRRGQGKSAQANKAVAKKTAESK